jgi:hypothetical protein
MVNELRGSVQRTTTAPSQSPPPSTYASNIYPGIQRGCNLLGCALPFSPVMAITGLYTAGGTDINDETVANLQTQFADQLSWTHGKRSARVGSEFEHADWNWAYKGLSHGIETFQSFADFLIGLPGNCGASVAGIVLPRSASAHLRAAETPNSP